MKTPGRQSGRIGAAKTFTRKLLQVDYNLSGGFGATPKLWLKRTAEELAVSEGPAVPPVSTGARPLLLPSTPRTKGKSPLRETSGVWGQRPRYYPQNCHHRRGAAFKVFAPNSCVNLSISWSLTASCSFKNATMPSSPGSVPPSGPGAAWWRSSTCTIHTWPCALGICRAATCCLRMRRRTVSWDTFQWSAAALIVISMASTLANHLGGTMCAAYADCHQFGGDANV